MQGIERLEKIVFILRLNKDPNYVNTDIYRLFDKEDLYVAAYEKMRSKPGNLTPGSDPLVHWALAQSELASVFDKNGKGVAFETPSFIGLMSWGRGFVGHRRGGQRTPASMQSDKSERAKSDLH